MTMRSVTLLHLDGRPWATGWFEGPSDSWAWVAETVAHEHGCDEEDVGCEESDEGGGDVVTVHGVAAYRVAIGANKFH